MRKKMNTADRKVKITISVNPKISEHLRPMSNVSKYVEYLIYQDLKNKEIITEKEYLSL
jgi:hypothetical protein